MLDFLKNSKDLRSAVIAGAGASLAYIGAALTTGIPTGGIGMLLGAAFSVGVNAIWQRLKPREEAAPAPTPAK